MKIRNFLRSLCVCALTHNALHLLFFFFSFSFSPSRQDFGRTGNFFANVLLVVAFNACESVFTGHSGK